MLKVTDLVVQLQDHPIVRGVSFELNRGELVVLMGQNGSGKSTLANALMGNPVYEVTKGKVEIDGVDVSELAPEEKVKQGLFMAWQNPIAIPGISVAKLLRELKNNDPDLAVDMKQLRQEAAELAFAESLLIRGLNDGFSGGEKKKVEMLQAKKLARKYVLFDEIDTGLDVDAIRQIAQVINTLKEQGLGILVITHYHRLINLLKLDRVIVIEQGQIIKEGGVSLAEAIEKNGYQSVQP